MEYVWYLSYGSNMYEDRFYCYILGQQYKDNAKKEQGCKDNTLPSKWKRKVINHELYFTKNSSRWQNMGVSFIKRTRNDKAQTFAKMYLITKEQFEDVVKQENGVLVSSDLAIDYNQLYKEGELLLFPDKWYGMLLQLGSEEGYPIYTFTSPVDETCYEKPSPQYLKSLLKGVQSNFDLTKEEIAKSFADFSGVKTNYTVEELVDLLTD